MPVVKKLTRIGDSRAVILPKAFLDQLALDAPDAEVEVSLEADRIIVMPHRYATDAEFKAATRRVVDRRRGLMKRLAKR